MKMDLTNSNRRVNNTNKQLNEDIKKLKEQQKEFIDWLEIEIISYEELNKELILSNYKKEIKVLKEVLSKYKDITGENR